MAGGGRGAGFADELLQTAIPRARTPIENVLMRTRRWEGGWSSADGRTNVAVDADGHCSTTISARQSGVLETHTDVTDRVQLTSRWWTSEPAV